jgi:isocitrate dehydrogenase
MTPPTAATAGATPHPGAQAAPSHNPAPHTRIALAKGDGIGPEIMDATLELFKAVGVQDHLEFVPVEMGKAVFAQGNTRGMTDAAIAITEDCGILFKGPMETPKGSGGKSINVTARKLWNTFANQRVFKSLPGVTTVYSRAGIGIDMTIVRENVEDTYGGVETRMTADTTQCKRLITAPGCDEVHRFALQTARKLGIKKVHCGHKANIMKMTDGLFLERFKAVGKDFPDVEQGDVIVDALCMNLVLRPQQYQLVVLPNLMGDIVSDLCAGLVGGLGFAPSANIGKHISIFEAVHGTAPDLVGQNKANPTALILSGLMMLRHLGMTQQAANIENALLTALEDGVRTGDFGDQAKPALSTRDFVKQIIERLGRKPKTVPAALEPQTPPAPWRRPIRPQHQEVIRTYTTAVTQVHGCDLYLETALTPPVLAEEMQRFTADSPFKLTLISSRGTQVWPTGSIYTECVDYYRVRFELKDPAASANFGQSRCIALLDRISEKFLVAEYDLLRAYDGVKGYSLAQGQ